MRYSEAADIINNTRDVHGEHIGYFYKDTKVCIDGFFVIDEIEAILTVMKLTKCKQSHDPRFGKK